MTDGQDNHLTSARITNAVLAEKLDNLIERVDAQTAAIIGRLDKTDGRVRENELGVARLQERQNILAVVQGGISLALSTVAGWFGRAG